MKRRVAWAAGAAVAVAGAVALTAPPSFADTLGLDQNASATSAAPSLRAASAADRLIADDPAVFRKSPEDRMEQRSVTTGAGLEYVAYERTHRGLPVLGGDAVVVTDAQGRVLSTWVAQKAELDVTSTRAGLSAAKATRIARQQLAKVTSAAAPKLVVVADGAGKLAFEVVVEGVGADGSPAKLHVVLDARSGKVIKDRTWNEVVHAKGNGGYYKDVDLDTTGSSMVDSSRGGMQCGGQDGRPYTSSSGTWGNGQSNDLQSACVDAMYAGMKQWDMLKNWLGRNGANGQGKMYPMRVGLNQVNAFYNGSYTNFGHSQDNKRWLTNLDVVAHEQGHGIFQTTPGGSGGGNEAGGLNESTGDIFGALTEFYANHAGDKPDYEVGELPNLVGRGPIRYMYEPSKVGDPNCMWTGGAPEVHKGAGPQNHWFYLLAEGSNPTNGQPKSPTCNNSTVTGIGIEKAGKIFMAGLMRKTSGWTHVKARAASVAAARELFPSGNECKTVQQAWDAVSVKASGAESCPSGAPTNPGSEPGAPGTPGAGSADIPTVDVSKVKAHLQAFQTFADQNGGTRRSGRPGYTASLNYVAEKLRAAGYSVAIQECTSGCTGGSNLIADWPGGDENQVLMLGAHLDSVSAGPGINDNGSGSATILETALTVAEKKPQLAKHLRFGWWADEEQGLNGSRFYVNQLGSNKSKIKAYLNFDMVGSVNGGYFINNINTEAARALKAYYDSKNIPTEENTEGANRSDDASFTRGGIPASGVAAGASATLTPGQAQKWGKKANQPRDPCYHRACDTMRNIDDTILGHAANAQITAVYKLAVKAK
ncbi:MAG TPA: M28 family peptidase [Pilimelia sp.]|nr:M28 family peptidase [Pilimelia sp.]